MRREVLTERELHIIKIINLPSLLFQGTPQSGRGFFHRKFCNLHKSFHYEIHLTGRCSVKITDVLMDELPLGLGNVF